MQGIYIFIYEFSPYLARYNYTNLIVGEMCQRRIYCMLRRSYFYIYTLYIYLSVCARAQKCVSVCVCMLVGVWDVRAFLCNCIHPVYIDVLYTRVRGKYMYIWLGIYMYCMCMRSGYSTRMHTYLERRVRRGRSRSAIFSVVHIVLPCAHLI